MRSQDQLTDQLICGDISLYLHGSVASHSSSNASWVTSEIVNLHLVPDSLPYTSNGLHLHTKAAVVAGENCSVLPFSSQWRLTGWDFTRTMATHLEIPAKSKLYYIESLEILLLFKKTCHGKTANEVDVYIIDFFSPHTAALQTLADTDTQSRPTLCDTGHRSGRVRWRTGSSGSRSACQRSRRDTGSGGHADPPADKTHRVSGRLRPQPLADG